MQLNDNLFISKVQVCSALELYRISLSHLQLWSAKHPWLRRRGTPRLRTGATESGTCALSLARAQTPSPQLQCVAPYPPLQLAAAKDQTRQSDTFSLRIEAYITNISSFMFGESLTHAAQHRSWQQPKCSYPVEYNSEGPNRRCGRQPSRREACALRTCSSFPFSSIFKIFPADRPA